MKWFYLVGQLQKMFLKLNYNLTREALSLTCIWSVCHWSAVACGCSGDFLWPISGQPHSSSAAGLQQRHPDLQPRDTQVCIHQHTQDWWNKNSPAVNPMRLHSYATWNRLKPRRVQWIQYSSQTETYGRLHQASKASLIFLQLTKEVQSRYQNTVAHFMIGNFLYADLGKARVNPINSFHK